MILKTKLLTIGLLVGISSSALAANILIVTNPGEETDSLEAFLTNETHTVTRETRKEGPGNANDFDFIIVTRNTSSSVYTGDEAEIAAWNAVTKPILLMNAWICRADTGKGWGWMTNSATPTGSTTDGFETYSDTNHPFLTDLSVPTGSVFTNALGQERQLISNLLPSAGTTVVASGADGFYGPRAGIFTIDAGTILGDALATPAGNLRIGWTFRQLNGWDHINGNGEQILRNILAFAIQDPTVPVVITNISFESGTGDLLLPFTPGGANRILKSSSDLLSGFEEEASATLELFDTQFRVPAANLDPDQAFFRIE